MKVLTMLMMAALTILSVSVFAQNNTKQKTKTQKAKLSQVVADSVYQCPMKCEGDKTYAKAGKCPVCKMNLKAKAASAETAQYQCPMKCEGDKMYDKPGKCPKCGMNLAMVSKEKMKMEVAKVYTCPMHPDVTSDKPGKCSKCNMDLKEKKDDHSTHQH